MLLDSLAKMTGDSLMYGIGPGWTTLVAEGERTLTLVDVWIEPVRTWIRRSVAVGVSCWRDISPEKLGSEKSHHHQPCVHLEGDQSVDGF